MTPRRSIILAFLAAAILSLGVFVAWRLSLGPANLPAVRESVAPRLEAELTEAGLSLGKPVFMRIFKESQELEVWILDGSRYRLFRTYPICRYSGDLGPKLREGDGQSPEGFYAVGLAQMNPNSQYHLSFNLGFPNAFDRANGRTAATSWCTATASRSGAMR